MEEKKMGNIPLYEFFERVAESDDLFEAMKRERQEAKQNAATIMQQRKEILKGLTDKNKDTTR
jgi:hypothetical protein